MRIALTQENAIAECKAYSSPVTSHALNAFYGKLTTERLDLPGTRGWFVAIPGLTSDGHTLARKIESADKGFKLFTASTIYSLALDFKWITPIQEGNGIALSDHAMLLSPHGIAALAKQIDIRTRLPVRVLVGRATQAISRPELALLAASDYAAGLDIQDVLGTPTETAQPVIAEAATLVTVVGSREDFEYQFPASPEFFVGREAHLGSIGRNIDERRGSGHVLVLNAQSGWGKSSLALRVAHEVSKRDGFAVVFDARTASSVSYVAAALRKAAADAELRGLLQMPANASFASLQSAVRTLQESTWSESRQLLVFFDQFENVFRDPRLTQEFRDLTLAVRELAAPIVLGFCWKTDLVGLTENYPYRLRDEIRSAALVVNVDPFGPKDVNTLLGRLVRAAGHDLSSDLKQRLREYSQGLPWLLKKLASHILKELKGGTSEEALLDDALNIESLFQQDLAMLEAREQEALRAIAREAPVLVSDIVERVDPSVIQSLVDQRLVVRVGERIDVYWDTFREFLISGKLSVQETYILRSRAAATSKLLQFVVSHGGEATIQEATSQLGTSAHVVFNSARELRLLGILSPRSGVLVLSESLRGRTPSESEIRERVARALRRHAVFGKTQDLISASPKDEVSIDALSTEMPALFPAVAATPKTWRMYAFAFGTWLDYCGLLRLRGQMLTTGAPRSKVSLLIPANSHRRGKTFPHSRPDTALSFLRAVRAGGTVELTASSRQKVLTDLVVLGLTDGNGKILTSEVGLVDKVIASPPDPVALQSALKRVPGGAEALALVIENPCARAEAVGAILRDAFGLPWAASTTKQAGDIFRTWAKAAGIAVATVRRASKTA